MYFETGQGSALSANAHHGVDQQTLERAPTRWRARSTRSWSTRVVGFIGPEYLYDGKHIIRAGLEDHFCGKLHGPADGLSMSATPIMPRPIRTTWRRCSPLLVAAGVTFVMGAPGADDSMPGHQSTSFHERWPPVQPAARRRIEVGWRGRARSIKLDASCRAPSRFSSGPCFAGLIS